jgi:hypothetical protein
MTRLQLIAVGAAVMTAPGCVHNVEGHQLTAGIVRVTAQSVSTPSGTVTLNSDGTWGASRVRLVGDEIRNSYALGTEGYYGYVQVKRLPDGIRYTPTDNRLPIWTFVTEDRKPIPADLEVPLYLAASQGLGVQGLGTKGGIVPWVQHPTSQPAPDCVVVLIEIQGRQVAGLRARQGAVCPAPEITHASSSG